MISMHMLQCKQFWTNSFNQTFLWNLLGIYVSYCHHICIDKILFFLTEICCQWIQWWASENQEEIRTLSQPYPQRKPLWVEADRPARDPFLPYRQVCVLSFLRLISKKNCSKKWKVKKLQWTISEEI